jgi:hypothetical protein
MMIILMTVTAIVVAGVPLAAVVLVTLASRSEETARSIAGHAPGPMERAARRLLAFHATGIGRPACRARARGGRPARTPARPRARRTADSGPRDLVGAGGPGQRT